MLLGVAAVLFCFLYKDCMCVCVSVSVSVQFPGEGLRVPYCSRTSMKVGWSWKLLLELFLQAGGEVGL